MKTSEMIALLEKNPKLKFTSSLNGLTFTAFVNGREEIEFTMKPLEESYRTGSTFCVYWLKAGTWYIEEPGE